MINGPLLSLVLCLPCLSFLSSHLLLSLALRPLCLSFLTPHIANRNWILCQQSFPIGTSNMSKPESQLRLDQPSWQKSQPEPEPDPISDDNLETDRQNVYTLPKTQQKTHSYYMKEFVSRISSILQAIQAREALPDLSTCSNCHTRVGK